VPAKRVQKERYQNKLEEAKRELAEIRREIKKNGRHSRRKKQKEIAETTERHGAEARFSRWDDAGGP